MNFTLADEYLYDPTVERGASRLSESLALAFQRLETYQLLLLFVADLVYCSTLLFLLRLVRK